MDKFIVRDKHMKNIQSPKTHQFREVDLKYYLKPISLQRESGERPTLENVSASYEKKIFFLVTFGHTKYTALNY